MSRSHAEQVLELQSALNIVAERCMTTLGEESVRNARPTFDRQLVAFRLQQTTEALSLVSASEPPSYASAKDVRTPVDRAGKGAMLGGEELFRIAETLEACSRLRRYLTQARDSCPALWALAERLPYLTELNHKLISSVDHEGQVLDSASPALKKLRSDKNAQQRRVASKIQNLVGSTLKTYLQEPIYTIREGRYVVPVKGQYRSKVPGIVHDASASGQTLFVEPESIITDCNRLRELESAEREEVERILKALSRNVGEKAVEIIGGLEALAEIDGAFAKARYAQDRAANPPKLSDGHFIDIQDGHHPLIDPSLSVPVSVAVGGRFGSLLLTGPNTGGKTVTLKMLGLHCLMIHCGAFPPAGRIQYGPFTGVWADIGDEQSLQQSLSTFSAHLTNIAEIFTKAKSGDLGLLDELGAGTDPREGAALGKAILTFLTERGVTVAASTHYGELKSFAQEREDFTCAAMEFDVMTLRPTYHLVRGASGASHAFDISRRYGLPSEVVDFAESQLGKDAQEERTKSTALDRLLEEARRDRAEAERERREVQTERQKLEAEREELLRKLHKTRHRVEETITEAIRDARQKYRELLDRLKQGVDRESAITQAKAIEASLVEAKTAIEPEKVADAEPSVQVGDSVRLISNGQPGIVTDIKKSGKVVVQVGSMKILVHPSQISRLTEPPKPTPRKSRQVLALSVAKTMHAKAELNLRKMRVEEAVEALERFLDDAILAGLPRLRIVHGKGDGILRKVVREFLTGRQDISRFHDADPGEGGSGATIVHIT